MAWKPVFAALRMILGREGSTFPANLEYEASTHEVGLGPTE
jgi:hypothetical protein